MKYNILQDNETSKTSNGLPIRVHAKNETFHSPTSMERSSIHTSNNFIKAYVMYDIMHLSKESLLDFLSGMKLV